MKLGNHHQSNTLSEQQSESLDGNTSSEIGIMIILVGEILRFSIVQIEYQPKMGIMRQPHYPILDRKSTM